MQIPTLDGSRVSSRPISTPYSSLNQDTGLHNLAKGVEQLGQGLEIADDRMAKEAEKARQRAAVTESNAGIAQFQRDNTVGLEGDTSDPMKTGEYVPGEYGIDLDLAKEPDAAPIKGFLNTRGMNAAKHSADLQTYLVKRRQQIEDGLKSPEAKELFRHRSEGILEGSRGRIEGHVSHQRREAEVSSNKALIAINLRELQSEANYANDDFADRATRDVAGSLHALATTPEEGAASVLAWNAQVATTRIDAALRNEDWQTAERLLEHAKPILGDDAKRLEKDLHGLKTDRAADHHARAIVEKSLTDDGRVDLGTALDRLNALGLEPSLRKEARSRLLEYAGDREDAAKVTADRVSKSAYAAYNEGGWRGIPSQLKGDLNKRNPALYHQLQNETERRSRARNEDSAAARREQREIDQIAKTDFLALPVAEQAKTDLGVFLAGRGVSPVGSGTLKVLHRQANDSVTKGQAQGETEFLHEARAKGAGVLGTGKRGVEAGKNYQAEATLAYRRFVEANEREPNATEAAELIAPLIQKALTKPPGAIGAFFGAGPDEEFGYEKAQRERATQGSPAAAGQMATTPKAPAPKVEVISGAGNRKAVPADKLDAWLQANPGWRRR